MTPEQFEKVKSIFAEAMSMEPADRDSFLNAACAGDELVRKEVDSLLAYDAETGGLRSEALEHSSVPPEVTPTIKGYDIIRELHRGGQGIVYEAVQRSTKRKVAIKLLLEGAYASSAARKRFAREVEIVAQLKHPNIIAIFDSGETEDGRPVCVMDYVRGTPITQYVKDKKLTLKDVLPVFTAVCAAVNYAHQRGIIHRDLKPSNILVDADGIPKVLDFGLAKQLTDPVETLVSVTGQMIGTLPYMSPEQVHGNPDEIDTRTDIYALGVVLYELLTGGYPYPVVGRMAEVLQHIAETPPVPPTRKWSSDSGVSGSTRWRGRVAECPVDDEIETIVLKTLAKDRERRYQSAGEVARDIGHYLKGEPIEARRDSAWYVLGKMLRRYRAWVTAAAVFMALVIASGVSVTVLWQKAKASAEIARQNALIALRQGEIANRFKTEWEKAFAFASPMGDRTSAAAGEVSVRKFVDYVAGELATGSDESPLVTAALMTTVGQFYLDIGRPRSAEQLLQKALTQHRSNPEADPAGHVEALRRLAAAHHDLADDETAVRYYRDALSLLRQRGDQALQIAKTQVGLSRAMREMNPTESERLLGEALAVQRQILGSEHLEVAATLTAAGMLHLQRGDVEQARPYFQEAHEIRSALLPLGHPKRTESTNNVAMTEADAEKKIALFEEAIAHVPDIASRHPNMAYMRYNLGAALRKTSPQDSEKHLRIAADIWTELNEEDPTALRCYHTLGDMFNATGRLDEAREYLQRAVAFHRRFPPSPSSRDEFGISLYMLARVLRDMGRIEDAQPYVDEAVDIFNESKTIQTVHASSALVIQGQLRTERGDPASGVTATRAGFELLREDDQIGAGHPRTAVAQSALGAALTDLQQFEEAEEHLLHAYEVLNRIVPDNRRTHETHDRIVALYTAWGKPDEAARFRTERGADAKLP